MLENLRIANSSRAGQSTEKATNLWNTWTICNGHHELPMHPISIPLPIPTPTYLSTTWVSSNRNWEKKKNLVSHLDRLQPKWHEHWIFQLRQHSTPKCYPPLPLPMLHQSSRFCPFTHIPFIFNHILALAFPLAPICFWSFSYHNCIYVLVW